jgi:hypothetical protein
MRSQISKVNSCLRNSFRLSDRNKTGATNTRKANARIAVTERTRVLNGFAQTVASVARASYGSISSRLMRRNYRPNASRIRKALITCLPEMRNMTREKPMRSSSMARHVILRCNLAFLIPPTWQHPSYSAGGTFGRVRQGLSVGRYLLRIGFFTGGH